MSNHRKSWSSSKKLEILNYAKKHGIAKTVREFEVSNASIYNWQARYDKDGQAGLERTSKASPELEELRKLRRENRQLKELVAEKELLLRIKEELLKKSK